MPRPTCLLGKWERVRKPPPSAEVTELPETTLLGGQGKKQGRAAICSSCAWNAPSGFLPSAAATPVSPSANGILNIYTVRVPWGSGGPSHGKRMQLSVQPSPLQLESPALLHTHCWAIWDVSDFFPTKVSHLSVGSTGLCWHCYVFWEQKSLLFLSLLPFLSSAIWEKRGHWVQIQPQEVWSRAGGKGSCPDVFLRTSRDGDSTTSLGILCQAFLFLTVKKVFLAFNKASLVLFWAWLLFLHTPPSDIATHWWALPWDFCSLCWTLPICSAYHHTGDASVSSSSKLFFIWLSPVCLWHTVPHWKHTPPHHLGVTSKPTFIHPSYISMGLQPI